MVTKLTHASKYVFVFIVFLLPVCLQAQQIFTGQVVSATDQSPVSGASIILKGTKSGTSTGYDGKFSIRATAGQELIISGIGFTKQEVKIGRFR